MSEFVKEAVVKISADVGDLNKGMKEAEARIAGLEKKLKGAGRAGKKGGQELGALVPPGLSKNLTRMNEKTEVARQLLTQMGGATGAAAGQIVYYGGSLSKVIGGFTKFEWAAIGTVGAIAAVGYALVQIVKGPISDAIKGFEHVSEVTKKSTDAARAYIRALDDEHEGLTRTAKARRDIVNEEHVATLALARAKKKLYEAENSLLTQLLNRHIGEWASGMDDARRASIKASDALDKTTRAMQRLKQEAGKEAGDMLTWNIAALTGYGEESQKAIVAAMEAAAKARGSAYAPGGAGKDKGGGIKDNFELAGLADMEREEAAMLAAEDKKFAAMQSMYIRDEEARLAWNQKKLDAEAEFNDAWQSIIQESGDKRAEYQEQQRELEHERAEYAYRKKYETDEEGIQREYNQLSLAQQKKYDVMKNYATMGSNLMAGMADAMIDNGIEGAFRYLSGQLKAMALEAGARALMHGAMAVGQYAYGNTVLGGMHLAAAAQFAAFTVAYGAGSAVAGAIGGSSGTGDTGATSSSDFSDGRDNEERGGGVTIVINGDYFQSRDGDERVSDMVQRHTDRANPGRYRSEVD